MAANTAMPGVSANNKSFWISLDWGIQLYIAKGQHGFDQLEQMYLQFINCMDEEEKPGIDDQFKSMAMWIVVKNMGVEETIKIFNHIEAVSFEQGRIVAKNEIKAALGL